jgi:hypothetical protein
VNVTASVGVPSWLPPPADGTLTVPAVPAVPCAEPSARRYRTGEPEPLGELDGELLDEELGELEGELDGELLGDVLGELDEPDDGGFGGSPPEALPPLHE